MNNTKILQEKLHKMQKDRSYRLFTFEGEDGVKSMPALNGLFAYIILIGDEWFAKNGDQQMCSSLQSQRKVLFAETRKKLFMPTAEETAIYISPNHPEKSCCTFTYCMISEKAVFSGFCSGTTTGKYYTMQLPYSDNRCICLLDIVMTIAAKKFPDDIDKLRKFFILDNKYNIGDETIFEE